MQKPHHIAIKEFAVNSPEEDAKGLFILAHGAGKGMGTSFMEAIATGVVKAGVSVVRFHFPYMEESLRTGTKISPNGGRVLRRSFSDVISHFIEREKVPCEHIFIGGKSMGGRVAAMIAENHQVAGVICLGYPFHPQGKPERLRIEHLKTIQTPTLICQGERDPKGKREEIEQLAFSRAVQIQWLKDGDNNFKPRKRSGRSLDENMADAIQSCNGFITRILESRN
jgi:predicted alpha/beta-hydrolase family hydrolase